MESATVRCRGIDRRDCDRSTFRFVRRAPGDAQAVARSGCYQSKQAGSWDFCSGGYGRLGVISIGDSDLCSCRRLDADAVICCISWEYSKQRSSDGDDQCDLGDPAAAAGRIEICSARWRARRRGGGAAQRAMRKLRRLAQVRRLRMTIQSTNFSEPKRS